MENYFKRQIQLFGKKTQEGLANKKVLIVGAGGLGSSIALALSGSGIGEIDIVDFDKVEIHNIHRQIAFKLDDVGEYKAKCIKNLLEKRNPFLKVNAIVNSFENANLEKKYDLICDATDNLQTRLKIDNFALKLNIPWIYGSVEEFNGQVCFFDKARFGEIFNIQNTAPKGILPPMVMQIASFQANLAIRYLSNLEVKKDLLYYFFINNEGELEIKKLKV